MRAPGLQPLQVADVTLLKYPPPALVTQKPLSGSVNNPLRAGIRRDSHPLHHLTKPPNWAGSRWSQGCRKNDTFSPGAWRGDERARRVLDGVAAGLRRTMPVRLTHRAALAWVVGWG